MVLLFFPINFSTLLTNPDSSSQKCWKCWREDKYGNEGGKGSGSIWQRVMTRQGAQVVLIC